MVIKSIVDAYGNYWGEFANEEGKVREDFSELEGYYLTKNDVVYFIQINDKLVSISPSWSNPLQSLVIYDHIEGYLFRSPKEMPFVKIGETLKFIEGEEGKILLESDNARAYRFSLDE